MFAAGLTLFIVGLVGSAAWALLRWLFGVTLSGKTQAVRFRWAVWPPALGFLCFSTGISLLVVQGSGYAVLYALLVAVLFFGFLFAYVSSLHRVRTGTSNHEENKYWNSDKAFGGSVFGDAAVTIALLSGAGAYQLSRLAPNWFWLGQFGVYLALLVGVSQALRALMGAYGKVETDMKFDHWFAFGNLAIAYLTLLALMAPVKNSEAISRNWVYTGLQIGALGIVGVGGLILIVIFYYYFSASRQSVDRDAWLYWAKLVLTLLTIGALIGFRLLPGEAPDYLPAILGVCALLIWECMEFFSLGYNVAEYGDSGDQVAARKLLRGSLILVGNIFMMALMIWVAPAPPTVFIGGHWILFCAGITLPSIAVLIGIDIGIKSLADKHVTVVQDVEMMHMPGGGGH